MVGVDTAIIFRFQNVEVRFLASESGSPSLPADAGNLSTSSANTILIGRDASPAGLFAPTRLRLPPGKTLCSVVLFESLARGSLTLPNKHGVDLSRPEATRSFEKD